MNVTISIRTNPGATWEDLSCALERLVKCCDAHESYELDECRLRVSMEGLGSIVSADLDIVR